MEEQYICTICGYNMIGLHPEYCPFCEAPESVFLTSEECSRNYRVEGEAVTEKVLRLTAIPKLGLQHSAYRIETGRKTFWIDCPSCFDRDLSPVDVIQFTHHHFLGASNQYRELFASSVCIHKLDAEHRLSRAFTFDHLFDEGFVDDGIEAFHVDGHTQGFTFYIFEDVLFICDYVLIYRDKMTFNPFGPKEETERGGGSIRKILEKREITTVCGSNYVKSYSYWKEKFDTLLGTLEG